MNKRALLPLILIFSCSCTLWAQSSLKVETLQVLGESKAVEYLEKSKNTADCDLFLKTFPKSSYTDEVLGLKEQFLFIHSYDEATRTFETQLLEDYLQQYPKGKYANQVKDAIDIISWQKAHNKNTVEALNEYVAKFPNGKAIKLAQKMLAKLQQ